MPTIVDDNGDVCELDDVWFTPRGKWDEALDRRHALIEDQLYAWRLWKFTYGPGGGLHFAPANVGAKLGDQPVLAYGPAKCEEPLLGCAQLGASAPQPNCRCGIHSITDLGDLSVVRGMSNVMGTGELGGMRQSVALALVVPFGRLERAPRWNPPSTVRSEYVVCFGLILPREVEDLPGLPILGYGDIGTIRSG